MAEPSESYSAQSEAEGIALAAACVAANKLFSRVIYKSHGVSGAFTVLENGTREEGISTPCPTGATSYMFVGVSFVGPGHYFFIVTMEGKSAESNSMNWQVITIAAPGEKESVLTEEELKKFGN